MQDLKPSTLRRTSRSSVCSWTPTTAASKSSGAPIARSCGLGESRFRRTQGGRGSTRKALFTDSPPPPQNSCGYDTGYGSKPRTPVNIPIPTKIDLNGWCTYPKLVPLVLTHGENPGRPVMDPFLGCSKVILNPCLGLRKGSPL